MDSSGGTSGKEPTCQYKRCKRCQFSPWVGKIPWRRAWPFTLVFLPGESRGQRSLAILVSLLLTGLWWGKRESASSPFWFQLVWGLDAYGKHTINLSQRVRGLVSTAAAAAKLIQTCPTLCDPIDGSPLDSAILGILQARTLEWVAISTHRTAQRYCYVYLLRENKDLAPMRHYCFFLFFFKFIFMKDIALQYQIGFCHMSTQISHRYPDVPTLLNLPLTLLLTCLLSSLISNCLKLALGT